VEDVVRQPGDVTFVIDRMIYTGPGTTPAPWTLDPERIGVMGLSLGGMTATLVAFHRGLLDPRVKAAVSIAGSMVMFTRDFFESAPENRSHIIDPID